MRCVRILGVATNLGELTPLPSGVESWPFNSYAGYNKRTALVKNEDQWTRWFNFHSRVHMESQYPSTIEWFKQLNGSRPIYTQLHWPDFPGSIAFPRKKIQNYFATPKGPNRYFNSSATWLIAFAIYEGFERIELWGFELSDLKPGERYKFERPCFFYWVKQAQDRGIEVWYQREVHAIPFEPGDPDTYDGPLYGYSTKPEPNWDPILEEFL